MARPATRSRTTLWLVGVLAGSGLFGSLLYRSIRTATSAASVSPGKAPSSPDEPSEGERRARVQRETFGVLLEGFARDVGAGRLDSARGRLGSVLSETLPGTWLAPTAKAWLSSAKEVRVRVVTFRGGAARANAIVSGTRGDVEASADFTREQGAWRLTGLTLGGQPALLNQ
jgi:hypothetical protein